MLRGSVVSRVVFVGVLVLAGGVALAGPAQALNADDHNKTYDVEQWVTLDGPLTSNPDGRGDQFLNFDANWDEDGDGDSDKDGGPPKSSSWVDWPVNLIFVSDDPRIISTSKVKAEVDTAFPVSGGPMHARLLYSSGGLWYDEWDVDKGRKMFPSTCENGTETNPAYNYHFRIYGPLGESTLYHPDYGDFVIATSHIDYREGCKTGGSWSGWSESAEAYIAGVFRQHGKWVEEDKIPLGNAVDPSKDPGVSDGYATVIHLDKAPPAGGDPGDPPAVVDAGPDVAGAEGAPVELRGTASDNGAMSSVRWSYSAGSDVDAGASCTFGDASQPVTAIRCTDDGTFTVTLSASDGYQTVASSDSAVVHVSNVAPSLAIAGPRPWQVFRVGDPVSLTATVTDPGSNDSHTCTTSWDDGTTSTGAASGQGCGGTHTYAHAGMYTIRPTVTDDDGGVSAPGSVMVVVYDPNGPWANADGSYMSAEGALTGTPNTTGEGWFHLTGKYYPQDTTAPLGTARSWLSGSDYRFDTDGSTLDWLVVTPDGKAAARGSGTLAGHAGRYGFVFYAYDGCSAGGSPGACQPGADSFRAVVWPLSAAPNPGTATVYDNHSGAGYDVDEAGPVPLVSGAVLVQQPDPRV